MIVIPFVERKLMVDRLPVLREMSDADIENHPEYYGPLFAQSPLLSELYEPARRDSEDARGPALPVPADTRGPAVAADPPPPIPPAGCTEGRQSREGEDAALTYATLSRARRAVAGGRSLTAGAAGSAANGHPITDEILLRSMSRKPYPWKRQGPPHRTLGRRCEGAIPKD